MGTLQENQSLNAEYERNKKEREMEEEIERLNKMLEDKFYKEYPFIVENGIICKKNKEIENLHSIIKEAREYCRNDNNFQIITVEPYAQSMVKGIQRKLLEMLDKAGSDIE